MGFRRDRRDDDDNNESGKSNDSKNDFYDKGSGHGGVGHGEGDKNVLLERLVREASQDIPKLHMAYSKFFSGAEKRPPREERERLDQKMDQIAKLRIQTKPSASLNLKAQGLQNSYLTYKSLWEKQLLAKEKA